MYYYGDLQQKFGFYQRKYDFWLFKLLLNIADTVRWSESGK